MTRFINAHQDRCGVAPICRVLQVAPSTDYAVRSRLPSARQRRDEALQAVLKQAHAAHFRFYGIRKLWRQVQREGARVARCTVERLLQEPGLKGVVRGRRHRTPIPDGAAPRPADLVRRDSQAPAPNRLWVADITYVHTWSGFGYVAFIIDTYSRFIVGWHVGTSLHTDLVLTALEHALWVRKGPFDRLVHHADRGVPERLLRQRPGGDGARAL